MLKYPQVITTNALFFLYVILKIINTYIKFNVIYCRLNFCISLKYYIYYFKINLKVITVSYF